MVQVSEFLSRYEDACKPVVIQGLPSEESWAAVFKWQLPGLLEHEACKDFRFKVGKARRALLLEGQRSCLLHIDYSS